MQHAQEPAAETEPQSIRVLWLEEQGRVVEGELFQGIPKIVVIISTDREQTGVHLRLDLLEARQRRRFLGKLLVHDGVAHRRAMDVLDTGHHEADIAGFEDVGVGGFRIEDAHLVGKPGLAGGLDHNPVALAQGSFHHSHERHHPEIVVEPGVDDQGLQRRATIALGGRNFADQVLQHILHAQACLGAATYRILRLNADDVLDFRGDPLRLRLRQVHLVEDRHHLEPLLDRGVAVGHGLGFHALAGINHQQGPFAGVQGARHLVGKVHVSRGIDEVQLVGFTVPGLVVERDTLGLDGNPALPLQVHGVEDLFGHFTVAQAAADLDKTIRQGGLAVINVGDDGKVTDSAQFGHRQ